DPAVRRGDIDIQYLERNPQLIGGEPDEAMELRVAIAAALAEQERREQARPAVPNGVESRTAWLQAARREGLR
ncbi:MAG: hypothetical protein KJZ47_13630, partial [Gemmatimonadales bacterium]|nr:hypothetical protein [Gemmatimonadales bacterium]